MFAALRKMILPIIIIVLVFFLAMIVLEWGADYTGNRQGVSENFAGRINGEDISWQDWQRLYNSLYQNEARSSDYDVPDDKVREMEERAWQELVNDRLLIQQARKHNITVTDGEVYSYLRYNPPTYLRTAPAFADSSGQFNYQLYMTALADPQFAPLWNEVDPLVRSEITKLKLQQMIIQTAQVSDGEVRQAYIDKYDSVKVAAANAVRTRFTAQLGVPTDEDSKAYFEEHQEKYKIGERVILQVIKADKEPSELDKERARSRAYAIYDSVTAGGDFAEFARVYSEDRGSADKGGDLGWFARERMVREFDSAVWAMKEGEISTPVKSVFGWHVIKNNGFRRVDDESAEGNKKPKIDEVSAQHILVKEATGEETLEERWLRLEAVRTQVEEAGFAAAAEAEGLTVFTTETLARGGLVSYLDGAPEVVQWGLNAKVGALSETMDLDKFFCLVQVKDKLPGGIAEFATVKERVQQDLIRDKSLQVCRDTMAVVAREVKNGMTLGEAARKYGVSYDTIPVFSRDSRVGSLSSDQSAIGAAFALKSIGDISEPITYTNGVVVFQLLDRRSADLSHYDEVRDSVQTALLELKQRSVFTAWFTSLKDHSEIESNIAFQRRL